MYIDVLDLLVQLYALFALFFSIEPNTPIIIMAIAEIVGDQFEISITWEVNKHLSLCHSTLSSVLCIVKSVYTKKLICKKAVTILSNSCGI